MKAVGLKCPRCGGRLQLITDGMVGRMYAPAFHVVGARLPMRLELRPFLACSRCEYCVEVNR